MAIARVTAQDKAGSGSATTTNVYASTPTVGDLLVAACYSSLSKTTTSMPAGWVQAVGIDDGSAHSLTIWYKTAGVSEPTSVTFTSTASGSTHMIMSEWSGFLGTPTLDQLNSATSNVTNVNSLASGTTPTTTAANEVVIVGAGVAGSGSIPTWTNSITTVTNTTRAFMGNLVVSATGAYSTTFGYTGTAALVNAAIVTFKDVVGAANPQTLNNYQFIKVGDGMSTTEKIK